MYLLWSNPLRGGNIIWVQVMYRNVYLHKDKYYGGMCISLGVADIK